MAVFASRLVRKYQTAMVIRVQTAGNVASLLAVDRRLFYCASFH